MTRKEEGKTSQINLLQQTAMKTEENRRESKIVFFKAEGPERPDFRGGIFGLIGRHRLESPKIPEFT